MMKELENKFVNGLQQITETNFYIIPHRRYFVFAWALLVCISICFGQYIVSASIFIGVPLFSEFFLTKHNALDLYLSMPREKKKTLLEEFEIRLELENKNYGGPCTEDMRHKLVLQTLRNNVY